MIKRDRKNDLDLNQRIKKDTAQLSEKQFYIYDFYAYLFLFSFCLNLHFVGCLADGVTARRNKIGN